MRIATYLLDGKRQVGLVHADGQQITPFKLSPEAAQRGAQSLIEAVASGRELPPLEVRSAAVSSVKLAAPLPLPRRNLWCAGRNYYAHAKELSASVFKDNDANPESWAIVFTKVPESVIGPYDEVRLPGAARRRSAISRWTITVQRRTEGSSAIVRNRTGVAIA